MHPRTVAALSAAALAVLGCATPPPAPDTAYRQAVESAIVAAACEGPAVDRVWSAFHQWYAAASTLADYDMGSEAAALLRQGEMFRILGCPDQARASYQTLLARFPHPRYAPEREHAAHALMALPPPAVLPGNPTRLRIARTGTAPAVH